MMQADLEGIPAIKAVHSGNLLCSRVGWVCNGFFEQDIIRGKSQESDVCF